MSIELRDQYLALEALCASKREELYNTYQSNIMTANEITMRADFYNSINDTVKSNELYTQANNQMIDFKNKTLILNQVCSGLFYSSEHDLYVEAHYNILYNLFTTI